MHWILQENLFKESEWDSMIAALERFDIPFSVHKVVPFIGELVPAPEPKQEKVICFGSYSMRHSAKKFGWNPGVYDLEPFDFTHQLQHWGNLMLNADAKIVEFKDVKFDDIAFLRPIHDSKVFPGRVFEWKEFAEWQHKVCVLKDDFGDSLRGHTLVQICNPKKIYAEYRFWVVDGSIVTYSLYKRGDKVIYSQEVDERIVEFAVKCVKGENANSAIKSHTFPHRAYVLDVCDTPDGLKIVEVNTINAAGFYAGDVQKLILALEEMENRSF